MGITRRQFIQNTTAITAMAGLGLQPLKAQQADLIKKAIPKSGEEIPVVGIGTNRYSVGRSEEERKPLRDTLRRFHELGGSVIDTAPGYRQSEVVLGDLINDLGIQKDIFMTTKCDRRGGNATKSQVDESIERLQWSKPLDLNMVHSLRNWQDQLSVLREQKDSGRIRYIGLTTSRNSQHAEMVRAMESEDMDFVQLNYSIDDRTAEERLLPLAFDKGVAVMVNLPFGRASLFDVVDGKTVPDWAGEFGVTSWAQFFLKYIISHPAVTVAIPGTRKIHHIEDNMGAAMGTLADANQRKRMETFMEGL